MLGARSTTLASPLSIATFNSAAEIVAAQARSRPGISGDSVPLAKDREALADTPNDCWRRPYDPYAGEGARERYLKWEIELIRQIEREGDIGFRVSP